MIRSSKLGLGYDFNNNLAYAASGTWYSEWLDTAASGLTVSWLAETITKSAPSGTVCTVHYRVNDNKSDTAWSSSISGLSGRYAQVRVQFAKNEFAVSNPEVSNVVLTPEIPDMSATTNLALYSEDFTHSWWSKNGNTFVSNATTAPDGTLTATKIIPTTVLGVHTLYKNSVISSGSVCTASIYAKAAEKTSLTIGFTDPKRATFNLLTGETTNVLGGISAAAENVGNGWWRISITGTSVTNFIIWVDYSSYSGDNTSGLYLWGAQVEAKPYASQYVKTAGTTASSVSSKAVMIEEGTTNLIQRSEELDNAYWTKIASSISIDAAIAPDGTLSADKVLDDTSNAIHFIQRGSSILTSGTEYSLSFYAKKAELSWVFADIGGSADRAWFDLANGAVGTKTAGVTSTSIKPVGNGWYRCSMTATADAANINIGPVLADNTTAYTGTGTQGIYLWGIQAEQKPYPTSYLKTTGTTVTRNSDSLVIPEAAINPSSGSVIFRVFGGNKLINTAEACFMFAYTYSFTQNAFRIYKETNKNLRWYSSNDASQATSLSTSKTLNENKWYTIGATWGSGKITVWCDGEKVGETTSNVHLPDTAKAHTVTLGRYSSDSYHTNTLYDSCDIFHVALTDAEMALYTSTGYVIPLTEKHSYKLGFDDANFVHGEGGYRITPAYTLTNLENVTSGYVAWTANSAGSGTVNVDVSTDNGTTWVPVNSSGAITALENASASGKVLLLKQKFTTTTAAAIPSISDMTYRVGQKWKNAVSQYIKPLFNRLTLVPTELSKWQLENKKYMTSFINGARVNEDLSVPASGVINPVAGTVIIRAYFDGSAIKTVPDTYHFLFNTSNHASLSQNMITMLLQPSSQNVQVSTSNSSGSISTLTATKSFAKGWHTMAIRWSSSELSVWVDGVKIGTKTSPNIPSGVGNVFTVGMRNYNAAQPQLHWNNPIDEVHIFGDALTDAEMATYTNLPMDSTIAINEKHTYRNKFNGDLNYGTCGVWISKWLDAGVNAVNTPWIELEYDAVTPEGTSVSFMCRTSANSDGSDPSDWSTDITTLTGRYIQIKAFLKTDNANGLTPRINSINPVAKYF